MICNICPLVSTSRHILKTKNIANRITIPYIYLIQGGTPSALPTHLTETLSALHEGLSPCYNWACWDINGVTAGGWYDALMHLYSTTTCSPTRPAVDMPCLTEDATDNTQKKRAETCAPQSLAVGFLREAPAVWIVQWEWITSWAPYCVYEARNMKQLATSFSSSWSGLLNPTSK